MDSKSNEEALQGAGKHTVSVGLDSSKRSEGVANNNHSCNEMFMTFKNKSNQKSKQKKLSTSIKKYKDKDNNSLSNTKQKLNFTHSRSKLKINEKQNQNHKRSKNNMKSKSKSKQKINFNQNSPEQKKAQIKTYDKKVRKNNKKFISRQSSAENIQMRLPWGVDQPRMNNYVLQTLAKMSKLRKTKHYQRQNTFNTQRSQQLKQTNNRLQLTPKRGQNLHYAKKGSTLKQKLSKSPIYDQKTKSKSKNKNLLQEHHPTQKPAKKVNKNTINYEDEQDIKIKQKAERISQIIYKSFNGQFQVIEKNNLYQLNFRIVSKRIIQIQVAILKRAENLSVSLNKGSLQCQSIHENYQNIMPKSSIILMTAVSGLNKKQKYIFPELHLILSQKNGSFGVQKKVTIPYSQINLLDIIPASQLKQIKAQSKIKNKSVIEQVPFTKQILQRLDKIFQGNHVKNKNKQYTSYIFGFFYGGSKNTLKLIINGYFCVLQLQSSAKVNTAEILENFQKILGI